MNVAKKKKGLKRFTLKKLNTPQKTPTTLYRVRLRFAHNTKLKTQQHNENDTNLMTSTHK